MIYPFIRSLLFQIDPELSHDLTLHFLKWFYRRPIQQRKIQYPVKCMGLTFPNPIGLAAGLDKNAIALTAWDRLGFGFIEVGTVTPRPQSGNSKPRLFRLKKDKAIINRMGFNNHGVDFLIEQIKQRLITCPLGVNIGKNKDTPLDLAVEDYVNTYQRVFPYADYVTVNLSSPNTPGLRSLQQKDILKSIVEPLKNVQAQLSVHLQKHVPLVVKISPDLDENDIVQTVECLMDCEVEGIIATNTTIKRPDSLRSKDKMEEGGLSGEPLFERSTQIIKTIKSVVDDKLAIIAVGGVMNAQQALDKFKAGASLVQLYTGFIYRGPRLIKEILKEA